MTLTLDHIAVRPGDAGYDAANTTFSGTGRAAVVLRPTTSNETAVAVRHCIEEGLEIAVRSGGHHGLNHANSDGGAVIDLSAIDGVEILGGDLVRVGAGATWGSVADALAPHGLALTSGDTRSVGVGGLTQSGGMGWMLREHGLTIDNLVAAEVVTAEGRVVRASETEHPDLLWGIKGGAGNFGVVTTFEFRAAHVTNVHAGMLGYQVEDVAGLVRGWAEAMRTAPEELTTALLLMPAMGDFPPRVMCFVCHSGGDLAEVEASLAPLRALAAVVDDTVEERPYADLLEEAHPPPGMRGVVNNVLVERVTDACAGAVTSMYEAGGRMVFLRALGGAFARVPRDATAFAHRDCEAMIVSGGFLPADAATEAAVAAVREPWWPVAEHGVGSYVGFIDSDAPADLDLVYPADTLERLVDLKRRWDPENIFRRNLNVVP